MSSSQNTSPGPRNVAHAVVMKKEDVFLMCEHGGGIPAGNRDGFGLYYHDCRFLGGYELKIAGESPNSLVSDSGRGSIAEFELTNPKLQVDGKSIQAQTFGIRIQRVLDSTERAFHDVITIVNYDVADHKLPLSLKFQSSFEDIFEIRGLHPKKTGRENKPKWQDGVFVLSYIGADGITRQLNVTITPKPQKATSDGAQFLLKLPANGRQEINLSLRIMESKQKQPQSKPNAADTNHIFQSGKNRTKDWLDNHADVHTSDQFLNATIHRCLLDLLMLSSSQNGHEFFSAGIPWYGTLFGRDSIIAALETLAYEPRIAEHTLRLLASLQGSKTDKWRDEQPGKIMHELRRGELANLNEIPQTPYYGSVDSTPLFLILIGEHANWSGDLTLFSELQPNIERALNWIDDYGDEPGSGYLSYATKSKKGLNNQGWKDSHDAIMNADGSLATPPIALAEVQGYVYRAKLLIADLYSRSGDNETSARLSRQANDLKSRFNRDFWLKDKNFYAMALQKNNRPAAVIGSNPGQALWTGIIDDWKAAAVVHHLMEPDMFSGWGIRTLSTKERRANPVAYHLGTVWPHDNAIIASGLRRYGFDAEAMQVMSGITEAARYFEHNRLPEVFAGYSRRQFSVPVRYPIACHPQAWAAGSVPYLLTSALGLSPDAFNQRLRVIRPVLPRSIEELQFQRIKVGESSVDLHFRRAKNGSLEVDANVTGNLQVEVDEECKTKVA